VIDWIYRKSRQHFIIVMMLTTRLIGSIGGGFVLCYVVFTTDMSVAVRDRFLNLGLFLIALSVALTVPLAWFNSRRLREALNLIHAGKCLTPEQAKAATLEAVRFPFRQNIAEGLLVPWTSALPMCLDLYYRFSVKADLLLQISIATLLAIALVLVITFLGSEQWMGVVIQDLIKRGGGINFDDLPRSRLKSRIMLCFGVIITITGVLIGALVHQETLDLTRVANFHAAVQQIRDHAIFITLAAIFVGCLYSHWLAQSITGRLHRLVEIMHLVQGGDLTVRAAPTGNDELDLLARRFNDMIAELDSQTSQVCALNARLEDQVDNRTHQLSESLIELQRRHAELERINHMLKQTQQQLVHAEKLSSLGQLVAGLAHEINNSINAVANGVPAMQLRLKKLRHGLGAAVDASGQASLRPELAASFDKLDLLAGVIADGADRTTRIVNDMKTFSHPGRDRDEEFDLHRALDLCLNLSVKQSASKVHIDCQYAEIPSYYGPYGQLHQVFLNLMSNAIQAMGSSGGQLTVRTEMLTDSMLVCIRDTGPGVPEAHRHRIFDPFYTTKAPGVGTGLGLSISHSIITKLGGTIECEPLEPGQGAEFKLRIPLPGHVLSEEPLDVYSQSAM
jgi:signal transduction histidine kinase